ncbi:WSCD family member CG9164 [Teleopsis dalmanni]|uniref:WSCD family member CG9164 n=1 Tax=Teleopsis dalmanni TaxID=139649 RepID=UPI0018CE71F7|nr:WSCD family member CG9164 [Teleopsis dalmanni]
MAVQSWRICGISASVLIYIGGIIFLSMNNIPSNHRKRMRIERFPEFSNFLHRKYTGANRKMTIRWCTELSFQNTNLPTKIMDPTLELSSSIDTDTLPKDELSGLTALASFPGSGNTWLRYLIQQSTGILTGSIYKDYGLLKTGFPAESVCNRSVLLVKTHEWGPNAWKPFSKAILLVRDPEKAILAEFNRQSGGHIGFASPDRYKRTKGKYWQQFVTNKLKGWELMNISWARNFTGQVKVVFYDDLVNEIKNILREILTFLEYPINESLLNCAVKRKEGIFRRRKRILSFDPYTAAMKAEIKTRKEIVYDILGRHI